MLQSREYAATNADFSVVLQENDVSELSFNVPLNAERLPAVSV
jgi:hypothetical protein